MPQACFECGVPADYDHHVIPKSQGGRKTVPLCRDCQIAALIVVPVIPADIPIRTRPAKSAGEWSTKLTAAQVLEIRTKYAKGTSQVALSEMYGVSKVAIHRIVHRQTWQQLPKLDFNEGNKDESITTSESD
jgi:hypothetical protein